MRCWMCLVQRRCSEKGLAVIVIEVVIVIVINNHVHFSFEVEVPGLPVGTWL